jgi:hypothetical protein
MMATRKAPAALPRTLFDQSMSSCLFQRRRLKKYSDQTQTCGHLLPGSSILYGVTAGVILVLYSILI